MTQKRSKNRKRHLKKGTRKVEKIFFIFCEGEKTEKQYFELFKGRTFKKNIEPVVIPAKNKGKGNNSPLGIKERIKNKWPSNFKKNVDEFWAVIDRDQWNEQDIEELRNYCNSFNEGFCAVSNPCFEYWILLHFQEHQTFSDCKSCTRALKKYDQKKNNLDLKELGAKINDAVKNAKVNHETRKKQHHSYSEIFLIVEKLTH